MNENEGGRIREVPMVVGIGKIGQHPDPKRIHIWIIQLPVNENKHLTRSLIVDNTQKLTLTTLKE